jgi:uncharacterized membrane protein (DUF485 family)
MTVFAIPFSHRIKSNIRRPKTFQPLMNQRRFFSQLGILTLSVVVVVFILHQSFGEEASRTFSLLSVGIFTLLSAGVYFMAARAAISKDKNAFTRLIMVLTFVKLFLTLLLVIVYHRLAHPGSLFFLIPFFFVYIAYTVFETVYLTKLGKIEAR